MAIGFQLRPASRSETLAKAGLVGLVYFGAAYVALLLSRGPYGFAPLWPSSGILLAALLKHDRVSMPYLAAGAAASLAANLVGGAGWLTAIGFTLANLIEPLAARWFIRRVVDRGQLDFGSDRHLFIFGSTTAIAAALSTLVATGFAGSRPPSFIVSWFLTDYLGMLTVTPLALIVIRAMGEGLWVSMRRLPRSLVLETVAWLGFITLVSTVSFAQSRYPVLFLSLAAMMLVVVRLGTVGAAASVLIVALVSSLATAVHHGPVAMIHGSSVIEFFFLQIYLLVIFTAALPAAALLGAQRRLVAELRENNRMLNMAEAAAQLGHWRLGADGRLFWSDETFRLHGMQPGAAPTLDEVLQLYHEEDRLRISVLVEHALRDGEGYEIRARLRRQDGGIRHVMARAEPDRDDEGRVIGLIGMVQDVTLQSEQERALDQARIAAEESARAARIASETDPLTGLPNRRQLLMVLERATELAVEIGQPLSVAMLDLDHFKEVNDTFGHVVGDRVLCRVAEAATSALRATDLIGRFGGEEFIIVLPNASLATAESVAERVRLAIEAADGLEQVSRMTASLGVASWAVGEPLPELLNRADEALYEAKRGGRNLVRCAGDLIDVG